jgi:hypothetical protein
MSGSVPALISLAPVPSATARGGHDEVGCQDPVVGTGRSGRFTKCRPALVSSRISMA